MLGDCQVPSSLITSSHEFSDISLPITLALSYRLWLLKHFCGVDIRCRDEPLWHGVQVGGVEPPHPGPPVTLVSLYQPQVLTLLQRNAPLRWGWNNKIWDCWQISDSLVGAPQKKQTRGFCIISEEPRNRLLNQSFTPQNWDPFAYSEYRSDSVQFEGPKVFGRKWSLWKTDKGGMREKGTHTESYWLAS